MLLLETFQVNRNLSNQGMMDIHSRIHSPTRILRRNTAKKLKETENKSAKKSPLPAFKLPEATKIRKEKAPKRRHPSITYSSMTSTEEKEVEKEMEVEKISPFLNFPPPTSCANMISNVTNISHIFSSPKDNSKSSDKIEKDESSPSKNESSPSKKSKIDKYEAAEVLVKLQKAKDDDFKDGRSCRKNDYNSKIEDLKVKNADLKIKMDELRAKGPRVQCSFELCKADFPMEELKDHENGCIHRQTKTDTIKIRNDLQTRTAQSELLSLLECSSCSKLPKHEISRPDVYTLVETPCLYACLEGHILCQNCVDLVEKCPVSTCSEKDVKHRSAFAERILNKIFPNVQKSNVQCKFELCKAELPRKDLKDHETFCIHRTVSCPSIHRGACNWNGPLSKLIHHVKEKKCIQIIFDDSWYKNDNNNNSKLVDANESVKTSFKTNLGDFSTKEESVFGRNNVITHWMPVLLLSKKTINLWCHVVIQRDAQGLWTIVVYSMLPKECTDQIKVKITVGNPDSGRSFNFSGKLVSSEISREEAVKEGNFLHLHDAQIKPFKMDGDVTLFDYKIELEADAKLISKINLKSQKVVSAPESEKKISDTDIPKVVPKIPKALPKLLPKPVARFNVTFKESATEKMDTTNGSPKFDLSLSKIKLEPESIVQVD